MVHLNGIERRIQTGIREWSIEDNRRRLAALRERKRLHAENADDAQMTVSIFVRRDIALIPGDAKRSLRNLEDKEIVIGVRSEPPHRHFHRLHASVLKDSNRAACIRQARFGARGDGHLKTLRLFILVGGRQQRTQRHHTEDGRSRRKLNSSKQLYFSPSQVKFESVALTLRE